MANNRQNKGPVVVGGEPRIDFLPPETKKRKENRRQRRSFVALIILVAIVCGLGFSWSTALAATSADALKKEQAKTQALLAQQQKPEYVEARLAATDLKTAKDARLVASANEIMWADYFDLIRGQLPSGAIVAAFSMDTPSTLEITPEISVLLQKPHVASIFMAIQTPDVATADAIADNLQRVPAYADAIVVLIEWDPQYSVYKVEVLMGITVDALERRFFEKALVNPDAAGGEETEPDADTEEPDAPSASPDPESSASTETDDAIVSED